MAETEIVWRDSMYTFLMNFYRKNEANMLGKDVVNGMSKPKMEKQMISDSNKAFGCDIRGCTPKKWKNIRDRVGRCSLKLETSTKGSKKHTQTEMMLYSQCKFLHKHISHKTIVQSKSCGADTHSDNSCTLSDSGFDDVIGGSSMAEDVQEVMEECIETQMNHENISFHANEHDYCKNVDNAETFSVNFENNMGFNQGNINLGIREQNQDMDQRENHEPNFDENNFTLQAADTNQDMIDMGTDELCDAPLNLDFPKKPRQSKELNDIEGDTIGELIPKIINHELEKLASSETVDYFGGSICELYDKVDSDKSSIALKAILSIMQKYH
ncbi:hypothetical protein QAD02_020305 [Eretmocerus hayati]|uniref:Uncharacterized protein n=1 Tax=Eretmocerus hayati TaxID=131215 RepID=A0ACC2PN39_9HYME|nr:hypothetical protein QAD02_020305 [Eretmocerus hayati]